MCFNNIPTYLQGPSVACFLNSFSTSVTRFCIIVYVVRTVLHVCMYGKGACRYNSKMDTHVCMNGCRMDGHTHTHTERENSGLWPVAV